MNDSIRTFARFGPKLRGLIWFVYTVAWTTALLTPQPAQILHTVLDQENAFQASKTLHVSAYALFAILSGWLQAPLRWRRWLVAFLSAHALATEFLQRYVPERCPSWGDVGWDHIGIVLGLIVIWGWREG